MIDKKILSGFIGGCFIFLAIGVIFDAGDLLTMITPVTITLVSIFLCIKKDE